MDIGRHVEDEEGGHSSIQLLQMPWANISSRQTSRQGSQDPHAQDAGGGRTFRSSISHGGGFDEMSFGQSSPLQRRHESKERAVSTGIVPSVHTDTGVNFDSQVESLEKESREFCG